MENQAILTMAPYQSLSTLALIIVIGLLVVFTYREFELWLTQRAQDREASRAAAQPAPAPEATAAQLATVIALPRATSRPAQDAYDWRTQGL